MKRCFVALLGLLFLSAGWAPAGDESVLEGKLVRQAGDKPAIETAPGRFVALEGDAETMEVLADERLLGRRLGLRGSYVSGGEFRVAPFHTKAFWVVENGKKLYVSYWCETCAIRTYTPGICMCCQKETELQLRETL